MSTKKLNLKNEKIRELTLEEMDQVNGGIVMEGARAAANNLKYIESNITPKINNLVANVDNAIKSVKLGGNRQESAGTEGPAGSMSGDGKGGWA